MLDSHENHELQRAREGVRGRRKTSKSLLIIIIIIAVSEGGEEGDKEGDKNDAKTGQNPYWFSGTPEASLVWSHGVATRLQSVSTGLQDYRCMKIRGCGGSRVRGYASTGVRAYESTGVCEYGIADVIG